MADRLSAGLPATLVLWGREGHDQTGRHLRMNKELQEADPIPDAFPGQDPKVDQEWEKAKEDPMGGESPSS